MIRIFPRRNKWTPIDDLAFVGDPPLFRPDPQPVNVSVTFTWDVNEGKRLFRAWKQYYPDIQIGGPAFGDGVDEFVPGRFIKKGVTITSRGCPNNCPWCFVPVREGSLKELHIKDGWIVQDNNLLACSKHHVKRVFEMLERQPKAIKFSGGLDPHLFTKWHLKLMEKIRIDELWFSCDYPKSFKPLQRVADLICNLPQNKRRCYVLIGYEGDSCLQAEERLEKVFQLGFLPFAQLFQGSWKKKYSQVWTKLQRKWCRPAAYKSQKKISSGKQKEE